MNSISFRDVAPTFHRFSGTKETSTKSCSDNKNLRLEYTDKTFNCTQQTAVTE